MLPFQAAGTKGLDILRSALCSLLLALTEHTSSVFAYSEMNNEQTAWFTLLTQLEVSAILLSWEDEDPNLPVSLEIAALRDVFVNLVNAPKRFNAGNFWKSLDFLFLRLSAVDILITLNSTVLRSRNGIFRMRIAIQHSILRSYNS